MSKHLLRGWLLVLCAAAMMMGESGETLLEVMRRGDMTALRVAVKHGVNVESRDENGDTLLMRAAVYGSASDMAFLLAHGADVNTANNNGHTALMRAMPDLDKVKLLVTHGAKVNTFTVEGVTPLMIAAHIHGAAGVVRYLLRAGADFHLLNRAGLDAVMLAAEQGEAEILKVLLEAGASGAARAQDVAVNQPRDSEVDRSQLDLRKKRADGVTALMEAAHMDCEECVRMLLEHGADAKATTNAGLTALHRAAYQADPETIRLLLEAGAPVNVADDRGFTPLMMAVNSRTRNLQVVQMLLDRGADVRAKDASGRSIAEWAAIGGNKEIINLLPSSIEREPVRSPAPEAASGSPSIRSAVQKAITLLEENGPKFFPKGGCISCHNVSIPMLALDLARQHGFAQPGFELMRKQTVSAFAPQRENMLSGYCAIPGFATTTAWGLLSLARAGYAPDLLTDSIVKCLALEQLPDGRWRKGGDQRPPLSPETGIPGTAIVARAIQLYKVPALSPALENAVRRGRQYLVSTKARNGSDYPFRLLGLYWTNASPTEIAAALRDLLGQQRPDGGWAQRPDMVSDAYATGLSLGAISMTQTGAINTLAYQLGVAYLMKTQCPDGSWHVRSRAFGVQPYFESGFPHGDDQWISMAATAWAAIALLPATKASK
jgi:N-acyl-D-amino-acid deacylase